MIARDEWLKALTDTGLHQEHDPEALTIQEFGDMFGLPRNTAVYRLKALVRAGKARKTTKQMTTSYGRLVTFQAYRLVETHAR